MSHSDASVTVARANHRARHRLSSICSLLFVTSGAENFVVTLLKNYVTHSRPYVRSRAPVVGPQ
jgi:hypothetical protein